MAFLCCVFPYQILLLTVNIIEHIYISNLYVESFIQYFSSSCDLFSIDMDCKCLRPVKNLVKNGIKMNGLFINAGMKYTLRGEEIKKAEIGELELFLGSALLSNNN